MCEREGEGERGTGRRADGQSDEECERHARSIPGQPAEKQPSLYPE
jgi:hypothetical protein